MLAPASSTCASAPPLDPVPARGAPPVAARTARGVTARRVPCRVRPQLPDARFGQRRAILPSEPVGTITNVNSDTNRGKPTDTTARARAADPATRPAVTLCTGNGRPQPTPPLPPAPPREPRTYRCIGR
jgi:hypothetical protein